MFDYHYHYYNILQSNILGHGRLVELRLSPELLAALLRRPARLQPPAAAGAGGAQHGAAGGTRAPGLMGKPLEKHGKSMGSWWLMVVNGD